MKKNIVAWLVLLALLMTGLPVYAAAASIEIQVKPTKSQVNVGDTVEYVVTATGEDVVAMQFEVKSSEGLTYVPNSGATPKDLAKKLGVPAADWTEISKMFTFYNDVGITMKKGTELLRFTCKAEKAGKYAVTIYELLPYDSNFEYFVPTIKIEPVTVRETQNQPAVTLPPATEPPVTLPPATEPAVTEPAVSEPTVGTDATEPPATEPMTDSAVDVTEPIQEPTVEAVTDPTDAVEEPTQAEQPTEEATTQAPSEEGKAEEKGPSPVIWIILGVVAVTAAAVAALLIKKKKQD